MEEDAELSAEDLQELVVRFKAVYEQRSLAFPQDVLEQLQLASTSRLVSSLYLYRIYVDVYIFVYCTQPRQNHELHTNTPIQTCILYLTRPSHLYLYFVCVLYSWCRVQRLDGTTGHQIP